MSAKKPPQTHYDVLGVKPECTSHEIRTAFLDLSKAHHPDLHPSNPAKHTQYVRIMEAYTVLSKPGLRQTYDTDLRRWANSQAIRTQFDVESDAPRYGVWKDESIWEMRDKGNDKFYEERPYYGIKGIKRMSNLMIAAGSIFLMGTGALFHFVALKKSSTFTVNQLDRRDEKLGQEHRRARRKAQENGNNLQLELLQAHLSDVRE